MLVDLRYKIPLLLALYATCSIGLFVHIVYAAAALNLTNLVKSDLSREHRGSGGTGDYAQLLLSLVGEYQQHPSALRNQN